MKKLSYITTVVGFVLVLLFVSCQSQRKYPPYFVDRSTGWDPSVICSNTLTVSKYDSTHKIYHSYLFDGSNITDDMKISIDLNQSKQDIMKSALKIAFGDRYCGIGWGKVTEYDEKNGIRVYATNQTMVLVNAVDEELIQCIDLRLQKQFTKEQDLEFREGTVQIYIDIAKLTREEIMFYSENIYSWNGGGTIEYKEEDLPLTAQKAYEVTADDLYTKYANKAGGMGNIGGPFVVYDCKKSNSWLIVGNVFVQMLEKTNGERIFLDIASDDRSKPTTTQG